MSYQLPVVSDKVKVTVISYIQEGLNAPFPLASLRDIVEILCWLRLKHHIDEKSLIH